MTQSKSRIRMAVTSSVIRKDTDMFVDDINEVPSYAPYDDPDVFNNKKEKNLNKNSLLYLSKTELKVLDKLKSLKNEVNTTNPIYLDLLEKELGHPVTTLKKTIQKLQQKGFIKREEYKPGRGGWTIYSLIN